MEKTGESPCSEMETRTFSKGCVVTGDNGAEIAVVTMSITTLHDFQEEHTEALLEKFAQSCRVLYLEAGKALKTES